MTFRLFALTRDELESRIWAATTARPWMRRSRASVGTTFGQLVADLEFVE